MERTRFPYTSDDEYLYKLIHNHGYIQVSKDLIKALGLERAAFLSAYIDKYFYFLLKYPNNNGWFYFTKQHEMDELNVTLYTVKKYKTEFINLGLLEIEYRGMPSKQWMRINTDKLKELFKVIDSGTEISTSANRTISVPQEVSISAPYNKTVNNKNKREKTHFVGVFNLIENKEKKEENPPKDERTEQFIPLAKYLYEIVKTQVNVSHDMKDLRKWANDMRILVEKNKIDIARLRKALHWYKENVGGEYIPVIQSGYSLRKKFTSLALIMDRENKPKQIRHNVPIKPEIMISDGERYYLNPDGFYYSKEDPPRLLTNIPEDDD